MRAVPGAGAGSDSDADRGELGPALEPGAGGCYTSAWVSSLRSKADGALVAQGKARPAADVQQLSLPTCLPPLLLLPMPRDSRLSPHLASSIAALQRDARLVLAPGLTAEGGFGLGPGAVAAATLAGLAAAAAAPPARTIAVEVAAAVGASTAAGVSPAATLSLLPLTPRPLCPWAFHAALPWAVAPAASAALYQALADAGVLLPPVHARGSAERKGAKGHYEGVLTEALAALAERAAEAALRQRASTHRDSSAQAASVVDSSSGARQPTRPPTPEEQAQRVAYRLSAWPPAGMRLDPYDAEAAGAGSAAAPDAGASTGWGLQIDEGGPSGAFVGHPYVTACRELGTSGRDPAVGRTVDAWLSSLVPVPARRRLGSSGPGSEEAGETASAFRLPLARPTTGHPVLDTHYWDVSPPRQVETSSAPPASAGGEEAVTGYDVLVEDEVAPLLAARDPGSGAPAEHPRGSLYQPALHWLRRGVMEVVNELEGVHEMSDQHAAAVAAWARAVSDRALRVGPGPKDA